jgi:hypothetical protein
METIPHLVEAADACKKHAMAELEHVVADLL